MTPLRTWRWPIAGLVVLAAFGLACNGDTGGTGTGGGTARTCNLVEADPPNFVDTNTKRGAIRAAAGAYCRPGAIRAHHLEVWLEKEASDGKTWLQVGPTAKYNDIPPDAANPAQIKKYPVELGQCVPGYWRLRAEASGTDANGTPFRFPLPLGDIHIARIKCKTP